MASSSSNILYYEGVIPSWSPQPQFERQPHFPRELSHINVSRINVQITIRSHVRVKLTYTPPPLVQCENCNGLGHAREECTLVSMSQPSVEIPVEGGDHTRVDLGLSLDPPLISNTPELISPSIVIHEHQISDDLIDSVVSVSASDHTDVTHPTLEVVPSQALVLEIGFIPKTCLRLNDSVCVEVVTGPFEGHNIDEYEFF